MSLCENCEVSVTRFLLINNFSGLACFPPKPPLKFSLAIPVLNSLLINNLFFNEKIKFFAKKRGEKN